MDLVVDQMVQLEHVDETNRGLLLERFTRPAIEQPCLAIAGQPRVDQTLVDLIFIRSVEDRRHGTEAKLCSRPAEVSLQDLTHVHPARHAQRVEHDLHRGSILEEWHILDRHDLRDHPFVTMPTGHLVPHRNHPLGGNVDLHHLQHAAPQLVATLHAVEMPVAGVDRFFDFRPPLLIDPLDRFLFLGTLRVNRVDLEGHRLFGHVGRVLVVNQRASLVVDQLAAKDRFDLFDQPLEGGGDRFVPFALGGLERRLEGLALVFRQAHAAGEFLRIDHDPLYPRRDLERIVLHVFAGTTEDRVEQFFLRRQFRLALGGDLADENVARLHVGADLHDPRLVEVP